jgi:hypothetical protein
MTDHTPTLRQAKYHAEAHAEARKFGITDGAHNGRLDAFRHAYTSAVTTFRYLPAISDARGTATEAATFLRNPLEWNSREYKMDHYNNAVGRRIGETALSEAEIGRLVYVALQRGELITDLDQADRLNSVPEVPSHDMAPHASADPERESRRKHSALEAPQRAGPVEVRAYVQRRDGDRVHVAAHTRSGPGSGNSSAAARRAGLSNAFHASDETDAQELRRIERQARAAGLFERVGTTVRGPRGVFRVTEAGIKTALANAGVESTKRWFAKLARAKGDVRKVSPDLSQIGIPWRLERGRSPRA